MQHRFSNCFAAMLRDNPSRVGERCSRINVPLDIKNRTFENSSKSHKTQGSHVGALSKINNQSYTKMATMPHVK